MRLRQRLELHQHLKLCPSLKASALSPSLKASTLSPQPDLQLLQREPHRFPRHAAAGGAAIQAQAAWAGRGQRSRLWVSRP